jgi:hypothetical protein
LATAVAGNLPKPVWTAKLPDMNSAPHLTGFIEIIARAVAEEILAEQRTAASKQLEEDRKEKENQAGAT